MLYQAVPAFPMFPTVLCGLSAGHVAACFSFSRMAVSFVQTVKASEPVFTVALCGPLLGAIYGARVWLAVLMIVCGCTLSAAQEVSMDWLGLNTAMASNLGMVLRGIYSNQVLADYREADSEEVRVCLLISLWSEVGLC
jgi:solute carrier family 35, member E1